jgi:hypothetical protein
MIDQDKGSLLLKYESQTLKIPPQTAETLGWYDPPETLNMDNSTVKLHVSTKSFETLPEDRSGSHKHLREFSRSDLAYGLLDLRNIESPSRPPTPEIVPTYR